MPIGIFYSLKIQLRLNIRHPVIIGQDDQIALLLISENPCKNHEANKMEYKRKI